MIFWDTSAIVPLLVEETATPACREILTRDPDVVVWWATYVECVSAMTRRLREQALAPNTFAEGLQRLDELSESWIVVTPSDPVRVAATRALRLHPLRAADSLQLAAAMVASDQHPAQLPIATFDLRLRDAATLEGFPILPLRLDD